MPLSISSSNQRIPVAPYGKLWLLTLVFALLLGGGAEVLLRNLGHLKSVTDDETLWGMELDKARSQKADVVFAGASRMQLGLQADYFYEKTGLRVANLTIDGCSPIPVLKYIAEETDFSGTVLVSFVAYHLLDDDQGEKSVKRIQWYKETFLGAEKINPVFNKNILNFLQSKFVVFSANCGAGVLNRINRPIHIQTVSSRSRRAYFREMLSEESLLDKNSPVENDIERVVGFERDELKSRWAGKVSALHGFAKMVQERGGRVILVRFPTTGSYGDGLEKMYPREVCWGSLGELTGAETIHFKDYPQLNGLECPEGSHLNYDDALKMTDGIITCLLKGL